MVPSIVWVKYIKCIEIVKIFIKKTDFLIIAKKLNIILHGIAEMKKKLQ